MKDSHAPLTAEAVAENPALLTEHKSRVMSAIRESLLEHGRCPRCRAKLIATPVLRDHEAFACPSLRFCPSETCDVLFHYPHTEMG
jgi:hypothetical protein